MTTGGASAYRYLDAPNESALVRVHNDNHAAIDLLFFN
jgi:hypothetical protein